MTTWTTRLSASITACAVATSLVAVAAPAHADTPPTGNPVATDTTTLTAALGWSISGVTRHVTITGTLRDTTTSGTVPGAVLTAEAHVSGGDWHQVASGVTGPDGTVNIAVPSPRSTTDYRLDWAGDDQHQAASDTAGTVPGAHTVTCLAQVYRKIIRPSGAWRSTWWAATLAPSLRVCTAHPHVTTTARVVLRQAVRAHHIRGTWHATVRVYRAAEIVVGDRVIGVDARHLTRVTHAVCHVH